MSVSSYLDYLVRIVKGVSQALISTNAATTLHIAFSVDNHFLINMRTAIIMRCNPNTLHSSIIPYHTM